MRSVGGSGWRGCQEDVCIAWCSDEVRPQVLVWPSPEGFKVCIGGGLFRKVVRKERMEVVDVVVQTAGSPRGNWWRGLRTSRGVGSHDGEAQKNTLRHERETAL